MESHRPSPRRRTNRVVCTSHVEAVPPAKRPVPKHSTNADAQLAQKCTTKTDDSKEPQSTAGLQVLPPTTVAAMSSLKNWHNSASVINEFCSQSNQKIPQPWSNTHPPTLLQFFMALLSPFYFHCTFHNPRWAEWLLPTPIPTGSTLFYIQPPERQGHQTIHHPCPCAHPQVPQPQAQRYPMLVGILQDVEQDVRH